MHIILHISPCFEMKKTTLLHIYICFTLIVLLLPGCSVNKFIPEGGYLLDDVKIESDNKEIKSSQMNQYVRQSPNAKWFSLFRFPLYIYSASGMDSTKWINRFWRKLGDAPVIYSKDAAQETQQEIEKAVRNMGYMGAVVDLKEEAKGKRMKVSYDIHSGSPYIINNIAYDIADSKIRSYLEADSAQTLLHEGMRFDVNVLDEERQRITQYLQNRGYYRFNKDFITFQADTMLNTHKVDLTMELASFQIRKEDMPEEHRQYRIRNVNYILDADFTVPSAQALQSFDSVRSGDVSLFYKDKLFLRPKVISDYNFLIPGNLYRSRSVQNTYSALSRLSILKYSNIRFNEVIENDSAYLDAYITLSRNKNKSLSFEIEGTNSAGDLGAAASASYTHRNLFKGSETFTIKLRGAYEAVSGLEGYTSSNYMEYGVESSLNFPEFMFPFLSSDFKKRIKATSEVSIKYNWQIRPEFERTLASAAWSYRWTRRGKANHRFDLLDINYIYMPYTSPTFDDYLDRMDEVNPLLRHSYEDLFIVRLGYTYTYNSAGGNTMTTANRNSYSVRFNIEEASGVMQVVHSIIQLDGFIPVVPVGPCVKAVVSGSLGRHFLVIPLFRIIKVDFACQLLSRYIVEIVLWIEILRAVIVLTQILYTSRFGQRVILPCHMVRNEIHDDLQSAFMAACNQMLEFLHTLVYMLGQVRVDVIIIADGIRRACFPFHNGRVVLGNAVCSVIRLRSVRYQSGVPDVCSA